MLRCTETIRLASRLSLLPRESRSLMGPSAHCNPPFAEVNRLHSHTEIHKWILVQEFENLH